MSNPICDTIFPSPADFYNEANTLYYALVTKNVKTYSYAYPDFPGGMTFNVSTSSRKSGEKTLIISSTDNPNLKIKMTVNNPLNINKVNSDINLYAFPYYMTSLANTTTKTGTLIPTYYQDEGKNTVIKTFIEDAIHITVSMFLPNSMSSSPDIDLTYFLNPSVLKSCSPPPPLIGSINVCPRCMFSKP